MRGKHVEEPTDDRHRRPLGRLGRRGWERLIGTPGASDRVELIERYFAACSSGSAEAVADCFTSDAAIYDTNHPPVRGGSEIGAFWAGVHERWGGASWSVDRAVVDGDEAAIEWSMRGTHDGEPFVVRGSEHYRFTGDLIAEIRQYWSFDRDNPGSQLVDYRYEGRRPHED